MTIDKATESGWRPVTKQDLIDLFDGGEPQAARFRDTESEPWRHDFLVGFDVVANGLRYAKQNSNTNWKFCEIKTQVLRDPKFSDLENGPIECMIYPDGEHERPQKGILVGMHHNPANRRNTTGMEYTTKWLYQKDKPNASVSFRWHVKVVDDGKPTLAPITRPSQAESITDDGWRSPTAEDLANGPIQCEVRDTLDADWQKRELQRICPGSHFPYLTSGSGWMFCRIRK
jgi:hypothetical protein